MSTGILVLTHNGRPPTGLPGGGKRIAYQFADMVFPIGGQPFSIRPILEAQERARRAAELATMMPENEYLDLPRAKHTDGECSCGAYPNPTTTYRGRQVVICKRCKKMMRPRS